jgi:hypothetical protein
VKPQAARIGQGTTSPALTTTESTKLVDTKKSTIHPKKSENKPTGESSVLEREILKRKNKKGQASSNGNDSEGQKSAHADVRTSWSDKSTGEKGPFKLTTDITSKSSRMDKASETRKFAESVSVDAITLAAAKPKTSTTSMTHEKMPPLSPTNRTLPKRSKDNNRLPSSILIHARDPDTRLHSMVYEARRLTYVLLGFGVPLDSWMISMTSQGIMVREEVSALFSVSHSLSYIFTAGNCCHPSTPI